MTFDAIEPGGLIDSRLSLRALSAVQRSIYVSLVCICLNEWFEIAIIVFLFSKLGLPRIPDRFYFLLPSSDSHTTCMLSVSMFVFFGGLCPAVWARGSEMVRRYMARPCVGEHVARCFDFASDTLSRQLPFSLLLALLLSWPPPFYFTFFLGPFFSFLNTLVHAACFRSSPVTWDVAYEPWSISFFAIWSCLARRHVFLES